MGYAVYEDATARNYGVERWAGYGVPAVCDIPGCDAKIDRGMAYRCEEITRWRYFVDGVEVSESEDWDEEVEEVGKGCGLHFCEEHLSDHDGLHGGVIPKPDTAQWNRHMLTDESWAEWRTQNPERVQALDPKEQS